MGACLKLTILVVAVIVAALVIALTYILATKKDIKDYQDTVLVITTVIGLCSWFGIMYNASEEFFTTATKLKGGKESSKQNCNCCEHNCQKKKKDGIEKSGAHRNQGTGRCGAVKENIKMIEESKWPLIIYMFLLLAAISICYVSFCLHLPKNIFETKSGVSGTTINVYGIGKAKINNDSNNITLWNAADIANPEVENLVSFITTKRVTIHQTLGNCSESKKSRGAACETHADCLEGKVFELGNGIATGNCLNGTCEVYAWCPVEPVESEDKVTVEELDGVGAYFLHVINHIYFNVEDTDVRHDNTVEDISCRFNETPNCPIIPVEYIVQKAMKSKEKLSKFPEGGSTISIKLKYECTYGETDCFPTYEFTQLYTVPAHLADYDSSIITYPSGSTDSRIYIKATGILFLVEVEATIEYRTNTKLLSSVATAFAFISSTKSLTKIVTWILCMPFSLLAFCNLNLEKLCCKHKTPREQQYADINLSQLNSEPASSSQPNDP